MDRKRFQSEITQELADEAPPSPADEPLDEADASDAEGNEDEGYEDDAMDDAAVEEISTLEEGGDESLFEADGLADGSETDGNDAFCEGQDFDALEEAMTDALEVQDADEFFRTLLRGVSQVAGLTQRGATQASRAARRAGEAGTEGASRVSVTAGRVGQAAREAYFGKAERRAAAYGFVIQFFLNNVSTPSVAPSVAKTFRCNVSG